MRRARHCGHAYCINSARAYSHFSSGRIAAVDEEPIGSHVKMNKRGKTEIMNPARGGELHDEIETIGRTQVLLCGKNWVGGGVALLPALTGRISPTPRLLSTRSQGKRP